MNSSRCKAPELASPAALIRHPGVRLLAMAVTMAMAGSIANAANIDPQLRDVLQAHGGAEVLIAFALPAPELAPLAADADYRLRRRVLVTALMSQAETDQAATCAWLDARAIAYRSYWIANVIEVRVTSEQLSDLADRREVRRIVANFPVSAHLPQPEAQPAGTVEPLAGIEWGVQKIGAPAVWDLGYTGQGVVIAGQDTGYQWDHPALKQQYRGWNGLLAEHDYNWHDAIHSGSAEPRPGSRTGYCEQFLGLHTFGRLYRRRRDQGGGRQRRRGRHFLCRGGRQ